MLTLVIPCYNEQDVLRSTTQELLRILPRMGQPCRILYVDDGSHDATWQLICELASPLVGGLRLSHNVGHQRALWAGMQEAYDQGSDAIISIDADLQDDVEVLPRMADAFASGADVVYGVRADRSSDSYFKRTTAQAFYRFMNAMGCQTVYNHADFRLLSRRALEALLSYPERNLFVRGMVPLLGYREQTLTYARRERTAGESKYPLRKMLSLALDGVTSFSVKPLRMLMLVGLTFIVVALCIIVNALMVHARGEVVPGWTSMFISLWFVAGVLLIGLGIVGEYVSKIYIEVKRRPLYHVMERA